MNEIENSKFDNLTRFNILQKSRNSSICFGKIYIKKFSTFIEKQIFEQCFSLLLFKVTILAFFGVMFVKNMYIFIMGFLDEVRVTVLTKDVAEYVGVLLTLVWVLVAPVAVAAFFYLRHADQVDEPSELGRDLTVVFLKHYPLMTTPDRIPKWR